MIRQALCALAALVLPSVAFAEDGAPAQTLFPGGLDLPIVDGASVPADCLYPHSLRDSARYDLACVVLPAGERSAEIGAQYLGMLGQRGWHQGNAIIDGFTAVHEESNGCEQVLDIFPSAYPPAQQDDAQNFVIWFALERQQRCDAQTSQQ